MGSLPKIVKSVAGSHLTHAKLSKVERAFLAADLYRGNAQLVLPTMVQAAWLARVNTTYAHAALKGQNDRYLIETGLISLVPPAVKALPAPAAPSDDELVELARQVGPDRMITALEKVW